MLIPYQGRTPTIAPGVFIAPTAVIIGQVEIAEGASIWYGAVLRGDNGRIVIGPGRLAQTNAVGDQQSPRPPHDVTARDRAPRRDG